MITALVLPADPLLPVRPVPCDETSQRAAHALVGGPTEQIAFIRPDATLHVHADGEAHGLPRNDRATLLVWIHAPIAGATTWSPATPTSLARPAMASTPTRPSNSSRC